PFAGVGTVSVESVVRTEAYRFADHLGGRDTAVRRRGHRQLPAGAARFARRPDGGLEVRVMRWVDKLQMRLRSLLRRPRVEQELDDELRFHLEQQVEENLAAGMSPEEARYAARRSIGGVAQMKEECRDMRRVNWVQDL